MVRHTGEYLIDEEGVAVSAVFSPQATGINGSKLDTPKADRFAAYSDAPFGEQVFNIAMAEVEAEVQLDGVRDDVMWESLALVYIHTAILPISGSLLGNTGKWPIVGKYTQLARLLEVFTYYF